MAEKKQDLGDFEILDATDNITIDEVDESETYSKNQLADYDGENRTGK